MNNFLVNKLKKGDQNLVDSSMTKIRQLNKRLEVAFFILLPFALGILFAEVIVDVAVFTLFICGFFIALSIIISLIWISSIDREEAVRILSLKDNIISLTKDPATRKRRARLLISTSYRIIVYSTITFLMLQFAISQFIDVEYSFSNIVLSIVTLTTVLHFLPLQLKILSLREESHKMIREANRAIVDTHILIYESKDGAYVSNTDLAFLVKNIASNTQVIHIENDFLMQTVSDVRITIVRYISPIVSTVAISIPITWMSEMLRFLFGGF